MCSARRGDYILEAIYDLFAPTTITSTGATVDKIARKTGNPRVGETHTKVFTEITKQY